jgi:hypothetical protein
MISLKKGSQRALLRDIYSFYAVTYIEILGALRGP